MAPYSASQMMDAAKALLREVDGSRYVMEIEYTRDVIEMVDRQTGARCRILSRQELDDNLWWLARDRMRSFTGTLAGSRLGNPQFRPDGDLQYTPYTG